MTVFTTPGVTVTKKPTVLSVLCYSTGRPIKSFLQSEEPGEIKQWSQMYDLGEIYGLYHSRDLLKEFLTSFHHLRQ